MKKVKLGISGMSPLALASKALTVVGNMTSNPNFPNPVPSLTAITTAAEDLQEAAQEAESGAHFAKDLRNEKYEILFNLMVELGSYINFAAGGDALKITSSGLEVSQQGSGSPIGVPQTPSELSVSAPDSPGVGKANLAWKRVRGAKSYIVQCTTEPSSAPQTQWSDVQVCTKARCEISGLNSGSYYSFRVIAVGAAGASNPSSAVTAVIG